MCAVCRNQSAWTLFRTRAGCDSGFGHLFALRLNAVGFDVIACCLQPDADGAASLRSRAAFPEKLMVVALDVTSNASVGDAEKIVKEHLKKRGVELWAVVNNAGIARCSEVEVNQHALERVDHSRRSCA